jgi:hypothetical protein
MAPRARARGDMELTHREHGGSLLEHWHHLKQMPTVMSQDLVSQALRQAGHHRVFVVHTLAVILQSEMIAHRVDGIQAWKVVGTSQ